MPAKTESLDKSVRCVPFEFSCAESERAIGGGDEIAARAMHRSGVLAAEVLQNNNLPLAALSLATGQRASRPQPDHIVRNRRRDTLRRSEMPVLIPPVARRPSGHLYAVQSASSCSLSVCHFIYRLQIRPRPGLYIASYHDVCEKTTGGIEWNP